MKKLKKLRIGKETLLPLESRQMRKIAGEKITDVGHIAFPPADATQLGHVNVTDATCVGC